MGKTRTTFVTILGILFALCLSFACVFGVSQNALSFAAGAERAEKGGETYLWQADFTSNATIPDGWSGAVFAEDGKATFNSTSRIEFPLDEDTKADSNNYAVEFEVQHNGSAFEVYFEGLDGTNHSDLLYRLGEGSGWYGIMRLVADGADVYTNSGNNHGVLNEKYDYDIGDAWHSVKLVHYNGYAEIWVDGLRRLVSHLESFGNNQYNKGRVTVEEGIITGFGFSAGAAGVCIRNLKIEEAVALETDYENDVATVDRATMPLSAQNLDNENYRIAASYTLDGNSVTSEFYPNFHLYGINKDHKALVNSADWGYSLNVQARVWTSGNQIHVSPQACYAVGIDGNTGDWKQALDSAEDLVFDATQKFPLEIVAEVYGNHIRIYFNEQLACDKDFGAGDGQIGFSKGHLQYVTVEGGNACTIEGYSYHAFDGNAGAIVKSSADRAKLGDPVIMTADLFGLGVGKTWKWYDGEEVIEPVSENVNGRTITATLKFATGGEHTIALRADDVRSAPVGILVSTIIVKLETDSTSLYPIDTLTFTVTLESDEALPEKDTAFTWYVNGEQNKNISESPSQETNSKKFTLADLGVGTYEIYVVYTVGTEDVKTYESNRISVTVKEPYVSVTTDKNNYMSDETARFVAAYEGIGESEAENITWYVNDSPATGSATPEDAQDDDAIVFYLDLADYRDTVQVYCIIGGVKSNTAEIFLSFDVLDNLKQDENLTQIYASDFSGASTFGSFSAAQEESGEYYIFSAAENAQTADWFPNIGVLDGTDFVFSYKIFIPEDYNGKSYVYPTLTGFNSKYSDRDVEVAFEVNAAGIIPYIKDQGADKSYGFAEYGFGQDLNYGGGLVDKGEWFEVAVALNGGYIGMYIGDEMALFFNHADATLPSAFSVHVFKESGFESPIRFKDFTFNVIKEPAPAVTGVSVSASSVTAKVGETVTLIASVSPYNAEPENIQWYINGEEVAGSSLTYTFSATAAGEYKFKCVVNGVASAEKVVTITGGSNGDGRSVNLGLAIGIPAGVVVLAGAMILTILLIKRKKRK